MTRNRIGLSTTLVLAAIVLSLVGRPTRASAPWTIPHPGQKQHRLEYSGTLEVFGHLARPGLSSRHDATFKVWRGPGGHGRFEWTSRDSADTVGSTEITILRGDSVFVSSAPGEWRLLDPRRSTQAWLQALSITATDAAGIRIGENRVTVRADPLRAERRFTWSWAHPRLGDVDDVAACRFMTSTAVRGPDPETCPEVLEFHVHERDAEWTSRVMLRDAAIEAIDPAMFAAPDSFDLPGPDENALTGHLTWETIAPGLHLASMDDVHSRSLVVEFADSLVVLEAAVSSANGERLVDAIHGRWPDKPIQWFLFSHHHPHYLGGLRAFVAAGATIGVAPKNEEYVAEITGRKFTRQPDRLASAPKALRIKSFEGRLRLSDGANEMVAVNIGERSTHTDDFLVFWFPRQKVLFETEQGWFARDGKTVASRRAAMLLKVMDDEKLDVDRIAQSWPFEDTDAVMTRERLAELVAARGK